MDMRQLVGRNVMRLQKSKRLTQEKLAEISGFSQQYISGLEKGQRNPTVVTLYVLSLALGVNDIELLKRDTQAKRGKDKDCLGNAPCGVADGPDAR